MALEFGSAAHEVFAACYLWQVGFIQNLPDHMYAHADRVLGTKDRFAEALKEINQDEDRFEQLTTLAFNIIRSSDFYDDPFDKIRTRHNLEMGAIKYVENVAPIMEKWPIWIEDENDPTKDIGVELSLDYIVQRDDQSVRVIGQADRVHEIIRNDQKKIVLGENKTGARLDSSWSMAFDMSNQITNYLLGLSTRLGTVITESRVHGVKTSQTGSAEDFNPITPKARNAEMFERFIDWVIDAAGTYRRYYHDYESAPRYTHSCNRYFRPCSLITFCTDSAEGRDEQLSQMETTELSPSEQAVIERQT